MSIELHLPRDHASGPEDVATLSSALEDTLRSLRLIDCIDPAVSMVAEHLIQLAKHGEWDSDRLREEAFEISLAIVVSSVSSVLVAGGCRTLLL
jgi:hypothetical protein